MNPIRTADSLRYSRTRSGTSFGRFIERLDRKGIPYLSHSKIACLERCPLCYYRQYVLGKRDKSTAMELGSLFHLAAKKFYEAVGGGLLPKPGELLKPKKVNKLPQESALKLRNALALLRAHHWQGHEVVSVEAPFFMDLAAGLPPIIGIPDLILRRNGSFVLVDHKTSKSFNNLDPDQLILYAEHVRRQRDIACIVGVFDEYRLVPDLSTIRKPAFRRTPISVDRSLLPALVRRYRQAWKQILVIDRDGEPSASPNCWICNAASRW